MRNTHAPLLNSSSVHSMAPRGGTHQLGHTPTAQPLHATRQKHVADVERRLPVRTHVSPTLHGVKRASHTTAPMATLMPTCRAEHTRGTLSSIQYLCHTFSQGHVTGAIMATWKDWGSDQRTGRGSPNLLRLELPWPALSISSLSNEFGFECQHLVLKPN